MIDLTKLKMEGEKLTSTLGQLLGGNLDNETLTKGFEASMGETRMELYRLSVFYGQESDRCRAAEAYFPACLMMASAIETLLGLFCLLSQKEVEKSDVYRSLCVGKKKKRSFEENILSAFFDNYIEIASSLQWIPSDVVDTEVLKAALQDFPLIVENFYPKESDDEKRKRRERFESNPGIEMLCMLQDMRNLIHGPRWTRLGMKAAYSDFEADCKFIYVISYQVLASLFDTVISHANKGHAEIEAIMDRLPPDFQLLLREQVLKVTGLKQ
jgi:hypothetical protein